MFVSKMHKGILVHLYCFLFKELTVFHLTNGSLSQTASILAQTASENTQYCEILVSGFTSLENRTKLFLNKWHWGKENKTNCWLDGLREPIFLTLTHTLNDRSLSNVLKEQEEKIFGIFLRNESVVIYPIV